MSHQDTPSGLASKISGTSGKHSLFEEEIRKLPISVCSVFLDEEGRIRPAAFKETKTVLTSRDHDRTLRVFPLSVRLNKNVVLEATSPQTTAENCGETGGRPVFRWPGRRGA